VNAQELAVNSTGEYGCTRFWHAAQTGDIIQVSFFLHAGADANKEETEKNSTPLMTAALGGHTAVMAALLGNGAEQHHQTRYHQRHSPLRCCAGVEFRELQLLLNRGADVG
jgi:ankyrin repeat protein